MKKGQIKRMDLLWSEIVKKRAGYVSEISGKMGKQVDGTYTLNAHHLIGKDSYAMRYHLDNGICITSGEHSFDAHGTRTRQAQFEDRVRSIRGREVYEELFHLRRMLSKPDLDLIEIYLKKEL